MEARQIIFIMTDTQRWDMCGCYRDTGLQTPHIDNLAQKGVRFERAYTTQPVCQPARAGIFTGQYPHSCASWSNNMGMSNNVQTIGQRLKDNGIHTAYIGKWHLDGSDYFGDGKCPDGWDEEYWYDMRTYLEELTDSQRINSRDTSYMMKHDWPEELTYGHRCADRAIRFLQHNSANDFFLTVSFDEPHHPFMCPPPYSTMYADYSFPKSENVYDDLSGKPDFQKVWAGDSLYEDKEKITIGSSFYFGCNTYVDYEIGRVLTAYEQYAPNALIIYTSDHGAFLKSHSLSAKGPAAYDEITRIPLIIAGCGIKAGTVDKNPVSHINLAPTIMELMGFEVPTVMDGKSIVKELEDPSIRVNDCIFIEFGRFEVPNDGCGAFQPMRSVFDGRFKLTVNLMSSDELYDLQSDPGEMRNLITDAACKDIRDHLHDILLKNMDDTWDPFRGYYWERRPWRTDAKTATWKYTAKARYREDDGIYARRQLDYPTGLPAVNTVRDD